MQTLALKIQWHSYNDDCWEGGTNITLTVPLTVEEYEAIEEGKNVDDQLRGLRRSIGDASLKNDVEAITAILPNFKDIIEVKSKFQSTLSKVADRIAKEICDGNKGGTPERDKMKHFENEIGLCNDTINQLECYTKSN